MTKTIVLCAVFAIPSLRVAQVAMTTPSSREEYRIYRLLIDSLYLGNNHAASRIVLFDSTVAFQYAFFHSARTNLGYFAQLDSIRKFAPEFDWDTILTSFRQSPAIRSPISKSELGYGDSLSLLSLEQAFSIFSNKGSSWEGFAEQYPSSNGIAMVSKIGFNADQTQAFLYFQHSSGDLAGYGAYVLLKKTGERWQILGTFMLWIS